MFCYTQQCQKQENHDSYGLGHHRTIYRDYNLIYLLSYQGIVFCNIWRTMNGCKKNEH